MSCKGIARVFRKELVTPLMAFCVLFTCCSPLNVLASDADKEMLELAERQAARQKEVEEYIWNALPFLKKSSLDVLRKLGPVTEKVVTEPNPYYPNKVEEYRHMKFQGLEIFGHVIDRNQVRSLYPLMVKITSPRWVLSRGIKVGVSAGQVQRALGLATSIKRDSMIYQSETDSIEFHLKNGHVTEINFDFYDG